eukprot:Nitzschia sp. Nitz4//scaffold99_size76975//56360//58333//NITZ4_005581-RA/size76975-processed-gene-0.51-mRNA-1//-1//CDS//3329560865//1600//frame0
MNRSKVPVHDLADKQAGSSPMDNHKAVRLVMDCESSDSGSTSNAGIVNDPDPHGGGEDEQVLVSDNNDNDMPSEPKKKKRKKTAEFKKHPDAPKRFRSAFILYSQTRHKEIREGPKNQLGELSTLGISNIISDEWRTMSDIERRKWEKLEQEDKDRFDRQKAAYRGPWKIKTNLRKPRDPTTPKKPVPAHFAYCNERRLGVKRQHPEATNGQISKLLSEMWKAAPEEEKKVYYEQEEKAKVVHEIVMEEWRQKKLQEKRQRDELLEHRSPKEALVSESLNTVEKLGREGSPSSASSIKKKKGRKRSSTTTNLCEERDDLSLSANNKAKSAKKKKKKELPGVSGLPHHEGNDTSVAAGLVLGRSDSDLHHHHHYHQSVLRVPPELQQRAMFATALEHQHGGALPSALYPPSGAGALLPPPPSAYAARFLPPERVGGAPSSLPRGGAHPSIHPIIPPQHRNHQASTSSVAAPTTAAGTVEAASRSLSHLHQPPPLLMTGPTANTQWVLCRVDDSAAYPSFATPRPPHHLHHVLASTLHHEQPYGSLTRETEFRRRVHSYYAEEIEARVQARLRATGNFRAEVAAVVVRPSSVHSSEERGGRTKEK